MLTANMTSSRLCRMLTKTQPFVLRTPSPLSHANHMPAPIVRNFRTSVVLNALQAGIVGLPNVGKSTLFNALVENGKAQAANFPFCTIEPNTGIVTVPDVRMEILSKISGSKAL
eukprot:gene23930-9498_t